jgi:hypothetical protein
MTQFEQQGIMRIAKPKSHGIHCDIGNVSVTWQAKLLHYVGYGHIPHGHGVIVKCT